MHTESHESLAFDSANSVETQSIRSSVHNDIRPTLHHRNDDENLRRQIQSIDGDKVSRVAILSFRALQLHRIANLQAELVDAQNAVMNPTRSGTEQPRSPACENCLKQEITAKGKNVDELLQRYAAAVRNYETLSQTIKFDTSTTYEFLGSGLNFKVTGRERKADWVISKWISPRSEDSTVRVPDIGPLGFRELDAKRLKQRNIAEMFRMRFHMALFGGIALIVPVIVMSLYPGLEESLITTSVATVIFSVFVVAFGADASGKDVLASTAAYTAVLVVFVGSILQSLQPD